MGALIALIPQLASTGITLYEALSKHAVNNNVAGVLSLVPQITSIYNTIQQTGDVLQKAQSEGWAENDARWQAPFDAADKALAAALARLT